VLEIEPRVLHMLSQHPTTWATVPAFFHFDLVFETDSLHYLCLGSLWTWNPPASWITGMDQMPGLEVIFDW
jgi:hypothetical protein